MAPPLRLSDDELTAVMSAARPIAPGQRDQFLQAVAHALSGQEIGPGVVHRVVAEQQQRFLKLAELDLGTAAQGKYAR